LPRRKRTTVYEKLLREPLTNFEAYAEDTTEKYRGGEQSHLPVHLLHGNLSRAGLPCIGQISEKERRANGEITVLTIPWLNNASFASEKLKAK
jgi:hypothetical protein